MANSDVLKEAAAALEGMTFALADAQLAVDRSIKERDRIAAAVARLAHPVPVPALKVLKDHREG